MSNNKDPFEDKIFFSKYKPEKKIGEEKNLIFNILRNPINKGSASKTGRFSLVTSLRSYLPMVGDVLAGTEQGLQCGFKH